MANDVTSKVILGLDPSEFRRGIQQVDAKLKETSKLFSNLGQVIGASFAVASIQQFVSESIILARQAEGVKNAFDALNSPQILDNLRAAVRGTVSDLELMKSANQAAAIGIEMNDLAKVMAYVSKYARATGQDMQTLMSDATLELVRQTGLRLDQLGISLVNVRERMKKTGDFTKAVLAEMAENTKKFGDETETAAEKLDRLTATIENQKTALGTKLLPVYSWFLGQFEQILNIVPLAEDALADFLSTAAKVPMSLLGGVDQANGQAMAGEQAFLANRQKALAAALAGGQGPTTFGTQPAKGPVQTLELLRGQLADYTAQLEKAEIGSKAFVTAQAKVRELTDEIARLTGKTKEYNFEVQKQDYVIVGKRLRELGNSGTQVFEGLTVKANGFMEAISKMPDIIQKQVIPSIEKMQFAYNELNSSSDAGTRHRQETQDLKNAEEMYNRYAEMVSGAAGVMIDSWGQAKEAGLDYFEVMAANLKSYLEQISKVILQTFVLSAVSSALTGNPFASTFVQNMARGNFNFTGTVSGFDLLLNQNRNERLRNNTR
jgi:hypothetical protein